MGLNADIWENNPLKTVKFETKSRLYYNRISQENFATLKR